MELIIFPLMDMTIKKAVTEWLAATIEFILDKNLYLYYLRFCKNEFLIILIS